MTEQQRRRARVSGGELSVLDVGHPDAPAVVLLHGYPTSSFLWRSFVPTLAAEMRVIAPDLLGAGGSERPSDAAIDAVAQTEYLGELLRSLDVSRFAAIGHGDGATVAQLLAVGGDVDALVLLDSAGAGASPAAAIERSIPAARSDAGTVIDQALRRGSARPERVSDEAIRAYARPFDGPEGSSALVRWAAAAATYPPGLDAELADVEAPTLLLWGEDDPFVTTDVADRLNERIVTSSLALLPGCGHFLPEEAATTIVPLVAQWLAGRYLGRTHSHASGPVPIRLDPRRSEAGA